MKSIYSLVRPSHSLSTVLLPKALLLCLAASRRGFHSKYEAGSFCRQPLYQAQSRCCPVMFVTVCCDSMSLLLVPCWLVDLFLAACNMTHGSWLMPHVPAVPPRLSSDCAYVLCSSNLTILFANDIYIYILPCISSLYQSSTSYHHYKNLRASGSFSLANTYLALFSWKRQPAMPT